MRSNEFVVLKGIGIFLRKWICLQPSIDADYPIPWVSYLTLRSRWQSNRWECGRNIV